MSGITEPLIVPETRAVTVSLLSAHYPYDTGWIPEEAETGQFVIKMKGPGDFLIHSLTIERTKWNMPLAHRISFTKEQRAPLVSYGEPEALVVASSQGDAATQSERLKRFALLLAREGIAVAIELRPADVVSGILMDEVEERFRYLKSLQRERESFEFGALYHPYWEREGWETSSVEISEPLVHSALERVARNLFERGVQFFIIRADDILPTDEGIKFGYRLTSQNDVKRYRTLAAAHADMMNRVAAVAVRDFPGREIYFVPPWYCLDFVDRSEGRGAEYLKELAHSLSSSVGIIWTGPAVRSLSIDELEYRRYSSLIGGRALSLWDNSLYARKHKDFWGTKGPHTILASNIEPYDVTHGVPYTLRREGEPRPLLYLNGGLTSNSVIQILTALEYARAPRTYHPERALLDVLTKQVGADAAATTIEKDFEYWRCRAKGGEECDQN